MRKRCSRKSGGGGAGGRCKKAGSGARKISAPVGMQMTDEKLKKKKNYVVGNVKFNKMIRNITEI